jgi:hypothetical protein
MHFEAEQSSRDLVLERDITSISLGVPGGPTPSLSLASRPRLSFEAGNPGWPDAWGSDSVWPSQGLLLLSNMGLFRTHIRIQ